ncbi:ARM repeat-containing protein [Metschnikowia bicuspidata var. bicuspidata NRRL YB-4993]|uniref:ARM repeat-containing protein n=1 Tax=Metschnikowia bicuspidata var. bicuspidata NRRL YB-4993 TaxID=869754 RepID=A0A1A0HGV8_9ASCO|nr:ARM repeat-containing protein [Metschnikowia bicuspidata var. bicuspidata NRRL YB-4993]OBA23231.1 ARM repeat-containing protein [Metschnikowia bicuspidata var. bicuspidata NRRL YB-4993]
MSLDFASRRAELYRANRSAAEGPAHAMATKLDSSLKKNTSFIKKIKALTADTAPAVLADISLLTLEKYLSEITASLAEGLLKLSKNDDINAGVVVICALYQRFTGLFVAPLLSHLVNGAAEKHEPDASLKQKTALKLLFEMQVLGMAASFDACAPELLGEPAARLHAKLASSSMTVTLLKDAMSHKLELGYALPVATSFLRRFSALLSGDSEIVPGPLQQTLRQLFTAYTTRILGLRQALHVKLAKLELSNKKASIRTGKILAEHEDLVTETAARKSLFDTHAALLCEFLSMELPSLEEAPKPGPETETSPEQVKRTWWHGSKERDFYLEVPGYGHVLDHFDRNKLPEAEYGQLSEGQKVNLFLAQLEALLDAKDLELMTATMHAYIPYNKATKNRIVRFFTEIKKIDNVNLYARFLCINAQYFPEVISELIEALDRGFRSQIRFDTINFRNLAFFIELVKFKLIPSHVVFHKIRRMTLNIPGTSNVDILLVFYERCGKFLLFEPEYLQTTKEMLELLQVQAKSDKLTVNEKFALSNMFLIVDSFTATAQKQAPAAEMTVVQDFIHQCVKKLVTPTSYQTALDLLKGINFSKNMEAQETLIEIYTRPEELGGDRLELLCGLLLRIGKTHRRVPLMVVETLFEKITRGLELNDYRHNVSRVAHVRFMAALFNAKVLNFKSILDLLYKIICFGYPNNLPTPGSRLEIDPPENYFRIQLVCALLKSINFQGVKSIGLLNLGVKTAEGLLVFLQYYSFCKAMPLPKDIEFSLLGVLACFNAVSKTKMQKAADLTAAMQLLQQYTINNKQEAAKKPMPRNAAEPNDDDVESVESDFSALELFDSGEEDMSSDDDAAVNEASSDEEPVQSDDGESASGEDGEETSLGSEMGSEYEDADGDEEQQAFRFHSAADQQEAQRMDDEIKTLLSVSMHQNRVSGSLRMPAPSSLVPAPAGEDAQPKAFKFLTKSNKLRDLALPSNNKFTERIALEQAAQKANRRKIMSLVDNMYES